MTHKKTVYNLHKEFTIDDLHHLQNTLQHYGDDTSMEEQYIMSTPSTSAKLHVTTTVKGKFTERVLGGCLANIRYLDELYRYEILKGQGHVTVNKPVISIIYIVAHTWPLCSVQILVDGVNPR